MNLPEKLLTSPSNFDLPVYLAIMYACYTIQYHCENYKFEYLEFKLGIFAQFSNHTRLEGSWVPDYSGLQSKSKSQK